MPRQNPNPADLNATLHHIHRLQDSRKERTKRGSFFVEGLRNFLHAVDAGFHVELILQCKKLLKSSTVRQHVRRLARSGVSKIHLCPEQFRRISRTQHASGIGAIVRQRWAPLESIAATEPSCWIALSLVRSPGNLGTLIRTSDGVGANGFVLLGDAVNPYDPDVVRASMGAVFRQQFIRTTGPQLKSWAEQTGVRIIAATPDASRNFQQYEFPPQTILLLGEERRGLTAEERSLADDAVRIPMRGGADSLNLGIAGSLLLYEVFRERLKVAIP